MVLVPPGVMMECHMGLVVQILNDEMKKISTLISGQATWGNTEGIREVCCSVGEPVASPHKPKKQLALLQREALQGL